MSILTTMGAPAERLVVPVITGRVLVASASALIATLGGAAAPVGLYPWLVLAPALPRPELVPVAAPEATLTAMLPELLAVGVTACVLVVSLLLLLFFVL